MSDTFFCLTYNMHLVYFLQIARHISISPQANLVGVENTICSSECKPLSTSFWKKYGIDKKTSLQDAQAAGYARFEKSLGRISFGLKMFGPKMFSSIFWLNWTILIKRRTKNYSPLLYMEVIVSHFVNIEVSKIEN